jgi:hypothetical protein
LVEDQLLLVLAPALERDVGDGGERAREQDRAE